MRVNMVVVAADSALAPYDITCTMSPHSCQCWLGGAVFTQFNSPLAGHTAMILLVKAVIVRLTQVMLRHRYTTLYHQSTTL